MGAGRIFLPWVMALAVSAGSGTAVEKVNESESVESSADSLFVLFWNVENFFDFEDGGGGESDREFSPQGRRHWTAGRFYAKCRAIAKSVYQLSSVYGGLPDVIGLAEVENRSVLNRLLGATLLRKAGYSIVHYDSPDHRGIDVALLWRRERFRRAVSSVVRIDGLKTRDLLCVELDFAGSGRKAAFVVCHLPSKYGGRASAGKRAAAAGRLRQVADSLAARSPAALVVMGDFNEQAAAFDTLRPLLTLPGKRTGEGSVRYHGRWELIDLFWVRAGMAEKAESEVARLPFLRVEDTVYAGEKPLRTYTGPKYVGGVSDHCPIVLKITDIR